MKTITYDETRWKLVPIEPTREMWDSAKLAIGRRHEDHPWPYSWSAMLAAAPTPPLNTQDGVDEIPQERIAQVWKELIGNMSADNGYHYKTTQEDFDEAAPVIESLMKSGYFADDPNDLDGSFWQAASPEFTEAPLFFSRAPDAYRHISAILTRIFERPDPEEEVIELERAGLDAFKTVMDDCGDYVEANMQAIHAVINGSRSNLSKNTMPDHD